MKIKLICFLVMFSCDKNKKNSLETPVEVNKAFYENSSVRSLSDPFLNGFSKEKALKMLSQSKKMSAHQILHLKRLSRASMSDLMQSYQKMVDVALKKEDGVKDELKLEMAAAAFESNDLLMFDFFLDQILESKTETVAQSAKNLQALLAVKEGRVVDGMSIWKEILKKDPTHEATLWNYGFYSLMYGQFQDGKDALEALSKDSWYKDSGLLVAYRHLGMGDKTKNICDNILKKHKNHRQSLFNCGVYAWQNEGNLQQAKSLMGQAMALTDGPLRWSEEGKKTLERVK